MIYLDDRTGSKDLRPYLAGRGIPVVSRRLEYGDASFCGYGPEEEILDIAVERKRITSDLIDSIRSGRLAGHQLIGLQQYDRAYLIVEGHYRPNPETGMLEEMRWHPGQHKWGWHNVRGLGKQGEGSKYRAVFGALSSYEEFAGVRLRQTLDPQGTAHLILCLYWWWREKYASHKAHRAFREIGQMRKNGRVLLRPATVMEEWMARLPHVGIERAPLLAEQFPTVEDLCAARVWDWAQAQAGETTVRGGGKSPVRIGRKRAEEIWRAIPRRK